jgi:purine-cytosine permease-like protein
MFSTLIVVLFVLIVVHVFRTGLIPVNWNVDPSRALSVLVAVLILLAFAMGFVDL